MIQVGVEVAAFEPGVEVAVLVEVIAIRALTVDCATDLIIAGVFTTAVPYRVGFELAGTIGNPIT